MRAIVAGAGLAGLCAARALTGSGWAVTIVEAGERAGGRACTERFPHGRHGELGGEFIDHGHHALRRLAEECGIELVRVLRGGFTHRWRGSDGRYHVSRERPWQELARCLDPLVRRSRSAGGNPVSAEAREMAGISLRDWLTTHGASADLHSRANLLRGFFLAEPDALSVLPVVEQMAGSGSPAQTQMWRVAGGTDRLVDALHAKSAARLLLRHHLRAVTHASSHVVAHVDDERGRLQGIEADAMVFAVPAPALRAIAITPALPDAQQQAIRALRYGCATKVLLTAGRDLFAGRKARAFATDTELGAFWDGNGNGTLLTILGGGCASRSLRTRAALGPSALVAELCWLGMAGAPVADMRVRTWEDDPLFGGGYAYFDPGFDPAWRLQLSRRTGCLVFAGEHTSLGSQGYMNGAVESGVRAARELIENPPQ